MYENTRGKAGANEASKGGKCYVCGKRRPAHRLIIAHYIGGGKVRPINDHIAVCDKCEIPEGYFGCGCGG